MTVDEAIQAMEKVVDVSDKIVCKYLTETSPIGNPALWKHFIPDEDYVPGMFVNSWYLGLEGDYRGPTIPDRGYAYNSLLTKAKANKQAVKIFWNSVPYAEALEDGWSTQAPTGIVKNATFLEKEIERTVQELFK